MMLPGFEKRDDIVGSKVNFDPLRLEKDESITSTDKDLQGKYRISEDCKEKVTNILDEYYSKKSEIKEYSWGTRVAFRCYHEDVETICTLLAQEIIISIERGIFDESVNTKIPYDDLIEISKHDIVLEDMSMDDISDIQLDIDAEFEAATPTGLSSAVFTREQYNEFVFDYVSPVVSQSNWQGGHAWLINNAIRELRNGRYQSAAYCFEGSRLGLTKHSSFDNSTPRLLKIADRALVTVRELCLNQSEPSDLPREVELFCELENRDLIFIPAFTKTPDLFDQHFRFQNEVWVANTLVLVQAIAHAMNPPTISRDEVDPFGSNLSVRNWSFIPKVAKELYELSQTESSASDNPFAHLEGIDLENLAPEITLTRILSNSNFNIRTYSGESLEYDGKKVSIDYDFIVDSDESIYIVRALRSIDRSPETVKEFVEILQSSIFTHKLIFIFDSVLDDSKFDYYINHELIDAYYVDMVTERLYPIESGFPPSFSDLTTTKEIRQEMRNLYKKVEESETNNEKGDSLELLMQLIFEKAIPDTEVRGVNVRTRVEEIDLQLTNNPRRYPWNELGSPINVECKNWSRPAGVDVIYTAFGKARATSPDCKGIILVCWEGISDTHQGRNGDQAIREIRGKGIKILTLDKSDLSRITVTGDAQSIFEEKADELWDR